MKLKELTDLEQLYEVTKPDGEEGDEDNTEEENTVPDIAAQLVHSSLCHYPSTLYFNLYQNHFSCIKDIKKYQRYQEVSQVLQLLTMCNIVETCWHV